MTHNGPMRDSDGEFTQESARYHYACKTCKKSTEHTCEKWDSSCGGYTDYRYTCAVCGTVFWIDGIDS